MGFFNRKFTQVLPFILLYFSNVSGQPYDGVLMKDYTDDYYRILDCEDCFKAQGRICHHKDYTVEVNVL